MISRKTLRIAAVGNGPAFDFSSRSKISISRAGHERRRAPDRLQPADLGIQPRAIVQEREDPLIDRVDRIAQRS